MRKVELTRQKLKRGALALFVKNGISETSTRQIATACEMSEGNIYRHFPSKEDLARELLIDQMTRIAAGLKEVVRPDAPLKDMIHDLVFAYCRMAEEDWLGFSYHLRFQHEMLADIDMAPEEDPILLIRDVVQAAMDQGLIAKRPVELVLGMAMGVVLQTAVQILYDRLDGPLTLYSEELAEAVWRVIQGAEA